MGETPPRRSESQSPPQTPRRPPAPQSPAPQSPAPQTPQRRPRVTSRPPPLERTRRNVIENENDAVQRNLLGLFNNAIGDDIFNNAIGGHDIVNHIFFGNIIINDWVDVESVTTMPDDQDVLSELGEMDVLTEHEENTCGESSNEDM